MQLFKLFAILALLMTRLRNYCIKICCIIFFLPGILPSVIAQEPEKLGLVPDKWAAILSAGSLNETISLGSLYEQLMAGDSLRAFRFLDSIENSANAKGFKFKAYFSMVKADFIYDKFAGYDKYKDRRAPALQPIKEQLIKLYEEALQAAYHTEEDLLIAWVNFYSARRIRHFGETAWAVMYSKNGVDLFEKINYPLEPPVYTDLSELLYRVKEYDDAIVYGKKGIAAWKKMNYEKEYEHPYKFRVRALNAIGSSFFQKKQYDSAAVYYRKALQMAAEKKDTLLTGKTAANIGRILFTKNNYDSAWLLFAADYKNNKQERIYNEAAHAAQWMAKASLAKGNQVAALSEAREAVHLLSLWPNDSYLRDTYYSLMQIFKATGNYDSAFYYSNRYRTLHDEIEKEVATSSLAVSKARLNAEVSRYNIQRIQKEKQEQLFIRNSLMAAIIALFLIIVLVINRGRLKHKMAVEKAEKEKMLMEQEIQAAREQMRIFTTKAIEKTNLIEKLELQIKDSHATTEQAAILAELMQHTILTEEDWIQFKTLFEKIEPFFFQKLKENAADLTLAEQRMAVLTRLQLTSKQMAAMLGISVDSVHKTRQRLRQRLQLGNDTNLDEYIAGV